jgi:hypothetical protein
MVQHYRRAIPEPKVLLFVTSSAYTDSVTLFLVIWSTGPSSHYNGFKRNADKQTRQYWQEETPNFMILQKLEIIRRPESGEG